MLGVDWDFIKTEIHCSLHYDGELTVKKETREIHLTALGLLPCFIIGRGPCGFSPSVVVILQGCLNISYITF